MSVYTLVSESELQDFLKHYRIGALINYEGVGEGIENTNYFVETSVGRYVLTLFEQMDASELPYFLDLMAHLADAGLPVPHPVADLHHNYLRELHSKPVTFITRLAGYTIQIPTINQCESLSTALAAIHNSTRDFRLNRSDDRDLAWCRQCSEQVLPMLNSDEAALLKSELDHQRTVPVEDLPQGVIHADLFRDNALFEGDTLTGVIDFYYACDGALLYDLAVVVNDWCVSDSGDLIMDKYQTVITAYQNKRTVRAIEEKHWQDMLRRAALRFWLSRLRDKHFPREGAITHVKNPDCFKNILLSRRRQIPSL